MYEVKMPNLGFAGFEMRQKRSKWLKDNFGPRDSCKNFNDIERWTYTIRPEGGQTFYFKNLEDSLIFKLVWCGEK